MDTATTQSGATASPAPPAGHGKAAPPPAKATTSLTVLGLDYDTAKAEFAVHANPWVCVPFIGVALLVLLLRRRTWSRLKSFEVSEAKLGIGAGTITLTPNEADRQVAYQIWVELSTRKIGLPIDLDNDVISEIYESWHQFFSVTRELIKSVPVSRASGDSTRKIINLSIEVLNEGLRPHLTLWQARFRGWHDQQLKASGAVYQEPQELQKNFPKFKDLSESLAAVNKQLIYYRVSMRKLAYGE